MRVFAALVLLGLASLGGIASADIPPPPDFYSGPTRAVLAGLTFARQSPGQDLTLSTEPVPHAHEMFIVLTDCAASRPNCRLAKDQKVLGYVVDAINGVDVENDLGAFQAAFKTTPKGRKVMLRLITPPNFEPYRKVEIAFDRK